MTSSFGRYDTYPRRRNAPDALRLYGPPRPAAAAGAPPPGPAKTAPATYVHNQKDNRKAAMTPAPEHEKADKPPAAPEPEKTRMPRGLGAYGCVYHSGGQRIAVTRPGEKTPILFGGNACLHHITHEEGEADMAVQQAGDYEITFELHIAARSAFAASFELQAGGAALPGGVFSRMIGGSQTCRGMTIAALKADDRVRLVMTSADACEAALAPGGVSAVLKILKLN